MDPNNQPIFSSGGASAEPSGPISSGTGDIVLSPTPTAGKSKKGIVVVIIILIVLALGGLGAWYLQRNGKQTGGKTLFNQYANFILFEKDSTENLDKFESFAFSKINQIAQSDETQKREFINRAKTIYDKFTETFQSNDDVANGKVKNVSTQLSDLSQYFATEDVSEREKISNAKIKEIVEFKKISENKNAKITDIAEAESNIHSLEYELFNDLYRSSRSVYNLLYSTGETE